MLYKDINNNLFKMAHIALRSLDSILQMLTRNGVDPDLLNNIEEEVGIIRETVLDMEEKIDQLESDVNNLECQVSELESNQY